MAGKTPRRLPMRKCTGCGEMKPKKELVRVVRSAQGEVSLDLTGKKPGRGAYVCPRPDCLAKARKAKRLERAFACAIAPEVFLAMEQALTGGAADE